MKLSQRHQLPILILIFLSILATKTLLKPGFYTSHDGEHQLIRQYIFDRAVKAGHFPPRVDRQLMNNLGYPLFTFTYQLPFWIGESFIKLGMTVTNAVKWVFISTFIASGLTMYLFAQDRWGRLPGFLAAFLYLWAPYRFLTIFVRAALGEHVALVFVPLLFWSVNKPKANLARIAIGGVALSGLILSHSMVAQMTLLPFGLFWLARFFQERKTKSQCTWSWLSKLIGGGSRFISQSLLIVVLGVSLSAFYLIPAIYYQSAIEGLNRSFYADHFVTLKQLIYSKWGYGFSTAGTNDGLSFQIGIAQWLVIGLSLILIWQRRKLKLNLLLALLLGFFASLVLMLEVSSPIWKQLIQKYFVVDLPWRLLAITSFTAAALSAIVLNQLRSPACKLVVFVLLILVALYTNRNHLRVNQYINFSQDWYTQFKGTSNSYDEYKPIHTQERLKKAASHPTAQVVTGEADFVKLKDQPHRLLLKVTAASEASLEIYTVYFPGWQLLIDGQVQAFKPPLPNGLAVARLSPGQHQVELVYKQTRLMRFANLISLLSLIALGWLILNRQQSYG